MADAQAQAMWVTRGDDRFGEQHGVGSGVLAFKVTTADSHGALLVLELTHHAQGGPARHLHPDQDEWFYVVAGEYRAEVGDERFELHAGDAVFAPRNVPHVWAHVGEHGGRLLAILTPAGQAEAFFRAYDLELVGPPLNIEETREVPS